MHNENDWELVSNAFDTDHPECQTCEFYRVETYWDTGVEVDCMLLSSDKGHPSDCPAFAELVEKFEDE